MSLFDEVEQLKRSPIAEAVNLRLQDFQRLHKKGNKAWFCELCYCLLTANARARIAMDIQQHIGETGFHTLVEEDICRVIREKRHRFHNTKAKNIVLARMHSNIKDVVQKNVQEGGTLQAREWLVENIRGLGYKEASHFLRNVGYTDVAIIDRHILRVLKEYGYIKSIPASVRQSDYIRIEKILAMIGDKHVLNQAALDLYLWYLRTGEILK